MRAQLDELVGSARAALTVVEVPAAGLLDALAGSPVALTTMGRGLDEDPAPFLAAAAAGAHAAALTTRAQRTSMRSTTKISVSPGLMAPPAPRSPYAEVRRDGEPAAAADLHALDALVPAGDDLADAEAELQRLAAVPGGVELLAGGVRDADVVGARRCWPATASAPSPTVMSSMTSSVGGWSPGKSISGRVGCVLI